MTLVPSFRMRHVRREREPRANLLSRLRPLPSSILALVVLLAFSSSAQAQTTAKPNPEIQAYTIIATPDGSSLCRDATPQERQKMASHPGKVKDLRLINHLEESQKMSDGLSADVNDSTLPGLKIFLLATPRLDANPTARAAFIKAAKNWEDIIKTPMTIYIKVDVGPDFFGDTTDPYDTHTIGSTSSVLTVRNFSDVRTRLINAASNPNELALYSLLPNGGTIPTDSGSLSSMLISVSLARALGILPANATASDTSSMPQIGFNSAFNFDYDQSDGISGGLLDFTAVATHEIGHALGFNSDSGDTGGTIRPTILDLFRFRPGVTDFTNAQRIMASGGSQIFFAGTANVFTNSSSEAGLSTGGPDGQGAGGDGRQSSHWRDDALSGFHVGIMDPTISNGRLEVITANDLKAFNYLGYNLENSTLPPAPTPPANDNFASAQAISGCSGSVNGTNIGAGKESGEPSHSPDGNPGGSSVWYRWQAPSTGSVTITTAGSNYDTLLGVYTGTSVNGLTVVAKNDDVSSGTVVTSSVSFNATANTTYRIAVDGFGGENGNIVLNWTEANCSTTPPPPGLQLGQSSYSVGEGIGSLNITVQRTGDLNTPFTVDYETLDAAGLQNCNVVNGKASPRCDYVNVVGKLRFASGDPSSKTISIPIVDDVYAEGTETFSLSLKLTVAGIPIGADIVTDITISDNGNDSVSAANPIDQTTFFVRQHYIDFLGREPDPPGLAGWSNQINQCVPLRPACDRLSVSQGIYLSPEFRDRGYFIYKFYSVALGRKPTYAEFVVDRARVSGFQTDAELEQSKLDFISDFMGRAGFANSYNGLTNNAYVQRLFDTAGVAQVTVSGVVYNVGGMQGAMAGGKTRAQVLRDIAESPEVSARFINESTIVMHYFGYLRRDPDAAYQDWINILTGTGDSRNVTNGFVNSAEYRMRFGQ